MSYSEILRFAAPYKGQLNRVGGGSLDYSRPNNVLVGSRSGSNVPDRREKISKGLQAGSVYSVDRYSISNVEAIAKTRYALGGSFWDDSYVGSDTLGRISGNAFSHLGPSPDTLDDQAKSKLVQNIRSQRSETNGLVILGEARETLKMLRHPLASLQKGIELYFRQLNKQKLLVQKLSHQKRRDAWADVITGTYLEAVFGWRPLFSDIKAILKTLDRYRNGKPSQVRLTGKAALDFSQTLTYGKTRTPSWGSSIFYIYGSHIETKLTRIETKYSAGLSAKEEVHEASLSRLLELSGFTLENFVPALWEITPWSFLIDYWSNMGQLLEIATTDTSSVLWITRTASQVTTYTIMPTLESPKQNIEAAGGVYLSHSGSLGLSTCVRTTVNRTLPTTIGVPPFKFSHQGSPWKIVNMLALLDQQRRGSRDNSWLSIKGR